ncbi:MAG: phenylalanine--tRNA ligase subunit alpha [Phycisphaerales bacterium]
MLAEIDQQESQAIADLNAADTEHALEQWRIAWLGSKGRLKAAMAAMKDVPKQDKPAYGQRVNALKQTLEAAFEQRQADLAGGAAGPSAGPTRASGRSGGGGGGIDVTEPGLLPELGRRHIITRVRAELCEVFGRMGFAVADGPELEDDTHNFSFLNIPDEHPARAPIDNFYVDEPDGALDAIYARGPARTSERPRMLRSQTSTVQIRIMQDAVAKGWGPPLKIVSPGRVYRPDTVDATHSFMFHQIEGLYIDRDVSMRDLKTTLFQFARAYFGHDAEIRLRPSFFPFTEPSAEFDMKIALNPEDPPRWIELGGCGMVDPNVFEAVGIDPEQWTGFAFGFGIERIAMGKHKIPDIRMLYENDLRFLRQL